MVWNHVRRVLGLTDERTTSVDRPQAEDKGTEPTGDASGARSPTATGLAVRRGGQTPADTEVATELDSWLTSTQQAQAYQWAPDDGITVSPTPITLGQELTIRYRGLLAKSGASRVFLHYGYGPGPWRHVSEIAMDQQPDGSWTTQIRAEQPGRLNFCFRDAASNWDNNNGRDWSYEVHGGSNWPH